ncbi:MAG: hypothetical protein AXA67_11230 [Methylothermaceae bacteria B42]|nr:MAG: hypothetical protein AXA67_11230 [Methylothermaceae bacteria B42]
MGVFSQFNPLAKSYDSTNALALGHAANLIYEDDDKISETLDLWGFTESRYLNQGGTQGYLASQDKMLLIAFRGTELDQLEDILADANVALYPGPVGQVHVGFLHALDQVWPAFLDFFYGMYQGQPVWLTGHSLGAALATLSAARMKFDPVDQVLIQGIYTYGSPRVGDDEFASAFDRACKKVCFRFRNNNDVVTRVPIPGIFALRYRHVGQLCYFDAQGMLHFGMSPWEMFWDRLRGRLDDLGKPGSDGLKDHAMSAYLEHLQSQQTPRM